MFLFGISKVFKKKEKGKDWKVVLYVMFLKVSLLKIKFPQIIK